MKQLLIPMAIIIHLFFYFSALKTHTLDYFFPWGNVHEWQGIDFYQVPNGAYAFLRGGDLTGHLPPHIPSYAYGNRNVYHPLFTLLIGTPLQLLSPKLAFRVWLIFHAVLTFSLAAILFLRFKNNKNLPLALFVFLALFPHYLEIWNGQYHFLLDASLFFLLLFENPLAYVFSLLIKPIGFLFLPTFILKKRFKSLILALGLFTVLTLPFFITGEGSYYLDNIKERIRTPIGGPPGIFTLDSIFRFWQIPFYNSIKAKLLLAFLLFFLQVRLRLNFFQGLFLWISFYLLFYDFVFEYHYTTLATLLAIGLLRQKELQTNFAKILALSFILPTPFFLFHFFQIGAIGHKVTDLGWVVLVLFRILPLILLNFLLIFQKTK